MSDYPELDDLAWSAFISAEGGNPERLRVVVAAVLTEAREAVASEIERVVGGYPENGVTRPKIERGQFANDAEWAAKIAREWPAKEAGR